MGRVGGTHAELSASHSAWVNPSLLAGKTDSSIQITALQNNFKFTDGTSSFWRWAFSFEQPLSWKLFARKPFDRKVGFGFSISAPFERIARFRATRREDIIIPRYGTSEEQLRTSAGLGIELIPEALFLGAGVSLFLNSLGSAEMELSENPEARMNVDVALQAAPLIGLYSQRKSFSTALVFREKIDPLLDQTVNARIQVNERDAFEQPFLLKTYLFFEPRTLDWDLQWTHSNFKSSIGLSYQFWQDYKSPLLVTETYSSSGETFRTQNLNLNTRNTLNPRASVSWKMNPSNQIHLGYQFRPSAFEAPSSIAVFDPDTHILGLGFNHEFSSDFPWSLGAFTQWHQLTENSLRSGTGWIFGISAKLR